MTEPNDYQTWRDEQIANAEQSEPDAVEQAVTGVAPSIDEDASTPSASTTAAPSNSDTSK
jgi:hypothetical protein